MMRTTYLNETLSRAATITRFFINCVLRSLRPLKAVHRHSRSLPPPSKYHAADKGLIGRRCQRIKHFFAERNGNKRRSTTTVSFNFGFPLCNDEAPVTLGGSDISTMESLVYTQQRQKWY